MSRGGRPGARAPPPLVALAWVHLEHHELAEARSLLKQADAALGAGPDKLVGALACLVAAGCALAEGSAAAAARTWPGPAPGGPFRPGSDGS